MPLWKDLHRVCKYNSKYQNIVIEKQEILIFKITNVVKNNNNDSNNSNNNCSATINMLIYFYF